MLPRHCTFLCYKSFDWRFRTCCFQIHLFNLPLRFLEKFCERSSQDESTHFFWRNYSISESDLETNNLSFGISYSGTEPSAVSRRLPLLVLCFQGRQPILWRVKHALLSSSFLHFWTRAGLEPFLLWMLQISVGVGVSVAPPLFLYEGSPLLHLQRALSTLSALWAHSSKDFVKVFKS